MGGVMHSLAGRVPISGSVSLDWSGIFADVRASYRDDYGRPVLLAVTCYWNESVIRMASLSGAKS